MTTPDIMQLLRRHVYGTKAERAKIEEAMAGVKVTEELAREAALVGLQCAKAGEMAEAKKAQAKADKWMRLHRMYLSRLQ